MTAQDMGVTADVNAAVTEAVALGLAGLLVEDVALEGLRALDQTILGQREALSRAAVSFLLRHKGNPPLRIVTLSEPAWLLCWGPWEPES